MKFAPLVALLVSLCFSVVSCTSDPGGHAGSGGYSGTGGSQAGTGGSASGGVGAPGGSGASASGGNASGGASASGGSSNSGGSAGGAPAGGTGGNTGSDGGASGSNGQSPDAGTDAATGGTLGGGGDAGTDAGGSGGGTTTFNPCPAAGMPCKIMPLGDSITFGAQSSGGGYRVDLFRQSLIDSKKITFVGRNFNGPNTVVVNGTTTTFPQNHEGYSGYTIDTSTAVNRTGISSVVDAALTAGKPHIVLLMIGTNDVNKNLDLANAPARLGNLLDRITTMAPNALLVVAKITPTQTDATNTNVQSYNNAIPGLVQTRASAGKHIIMVDMYAALTANASYKTAWLFDDLHPNDAGYVVMGQTWYAGIKSYLR
jgi:lysophospholipase L1-like esterase